MKKLLLLAILITASLSLLASCGGGGMGSATEFPDRGRYLYDEADRVPHETEISLAGYLWQLDAKTDYELVVVFPQNPMDENAMIDWFNKQGVGKKDKDNGAAIFVLPDNKVFVAIGSGNDKISVPFSKTHGERIFASFNDDPMLTLLRFTSALGGKVSEATETEIADNNAFDGMKDNWHVLLLWAAVIAIGILLIQQFDGFQWHDLILPAVVFVVLGLVFGIGAAAGSGSSTDAYKTYGVIVSTKPGSYDWTHHHTICTSTGKTTSCYTVPHGHTMYTNDVTFLSYGLKEYTYQFQTDEYKGAWEHGVGELDALTIHSKNDKLRDVSGIDDKSGGKTIGDGVWIFAAMQR